MPFFSIRNFVSRHAFLLFSFLFLLICLCLLPHYGLTYDSPKNFMEGEINLNTLLTFRPLLEKEQIYLAFQIHGAFFFMLGEMLQQIFSQKIHAIDPVSARHIYLPFLVFFFVNLYYRFLKKRVGGIVAWIAALILLTYPHFFGHSFNNIKDIPLFVSFAAALLCFYAWVDSRFLKTHYFYYFFIALGFALLSKLYALLVGLISFLWFGAILLGKLPFPNSQPPLTLKDIPPKFFVHGAIGTLIILVIMGCFFMPAVYFVSSQAEFWKLKANVLQGLFSPAHKSWSFYPFVQILSVTPTLTLAAVGLGLVHVLFDRIRNPLDLFMLIWLGVIIAIPCTPLLPTYDGIRLFMTFLVPFVYFSALGIKTCAEALALREFISKFTATLVLASFVVGCQIAGLIQTHPYQTTFFNALVSGLGGAQQKKIPDSVDFWLNAYREASKWIEKNAPPGSPVLVPGTNAVLMLRYYQTRANLPLDRVHRLPLPRSSFLLISASPSSWIGVPPAIQNAIQEELKKLQPVYEIKRQNGKILTIYYQP